MPPHPVPRNQRDQTHRLGLRAESHPERYVDQRVPGLPFRPDRLLVHLAGLCTAGLSHIRTHAFSSPNEMVQRVAHV
jgi:hypothetical protein